MPAVVVTGTTTGLLPADPDVAAGNPAAVATALVPALDAVSISPRDVDPVFALLQPPTTNNAPHPNPNHAHRFTLPPVCYLRSSLAAESN